MKKAKIGFKINDTKSNPNNDDVKPEENESSNNNVPPELFEEIEQHVLAKQDYEKSMHELYLFKFWSKLVLIVIVLLGIAYYCYHKGCENTVNNYIRQQQLLETVQNIYIDGYSVGFKDAKTNKPNNPMKHCEIHNNVSTK